MTEMDPQQVPQVDKQTAVDNAVPASRDKRGHQLLYGLVIFAALGVVFLFVWGYSGQQRSSQLTTTVNQLIPQVHDLATQQAEAAVDGQKLAAQLRGLGVEPTVTPPTPVTGQQGAQGIPGPGPTQAEIDSAVGAYFTTHPLPPGQLPPVSEVAGLVAQYLTANPPAPGQNATPQMVSDAVTSYCTARNGCAGAAGQDATDQQVAQQVAAYCAAHSNCAGANGQNGKDGPAGPQGVSITDLVFQRDSNGTCQAIVTLHDPATNTDNTVSHPAGDAACPVLSKPLIGGK